MDFTGWEDILKGLGLGGVFIVFLVYENARLRKDRDVALAEERRSRAEQLVAKDAFAEALIQIIGKANEEAMETAMVLRPLASAISAAVTIMTERRDPL